MHPTKEGKSRELILSFATHSSCLIYLVSCLLCGHLICKVSEERLWMGCRVLIHGIRPKKNRFTVITQQQQQQQQKKNLCFALLLLYHQRCKDWENLWVEFFFFFFFPWSLLAGLHAEGWWLRWVTSIKPPESAPFLSHCWWQAPGLVSPLSLWICSLVFVSDRVTLSVCSLGLVFSLLPLLWDLQLGSWFLVLCNYCEICSFLKRGILRGRREEFRV
jgi:hypothetical protein